MWKAGRTILLILVLGSLGWCTWRSLDASLPPLARDVPHGLPDGHRFFHARVTGAYPIGSAEARLVSDLRRQGFSFTPGTSKAREAKVSRFAGCGSRDWIVRWTARNGRLTNIWGVFGYNCL